MREKSYQMKSKCKLMCVNSTESKRNKAAAHPTSGWVPAIHHLEVFPKETKQQLTQQLAGCLLSIIWKFLSDWHLIHIRSIYIPWPFPPVWGVADNTKETNKNNGGFTPFFQHWWGIQPSLDIYDKSMSGFAFSKTTKICIHHKTIICTKQKNFLSAAQTNIHMNGIKEVLNPKKERKLTKKPNVDKEKLISIPPRAVERDVSLCGSKGRMSKVS